jgi:hypothetical protein
MHRLEPDRRGRVRGRDASLIKADGSRGTKVEAGDRAVLETTAHAALERLDSLDDAAFGGATPTRPRSLSPTAPAARFNGANDDRAFLACSTNDLVDLQNDVIVDVEATALIRQAETVAAQTMPRWARDKFGLYPELLAVDTACGSAGMPGRLVEGEDIDLHIPVFRCPAGVCLQTPRGVESECKDGALPAAAVACDHEADACTRPGGSTLKPCWRDI